MSSRSDSETENANAIDLRNDEFIKLLEENRALFDKSQTPGIQKKKRQSVERIQQRYFEQTSKQISAQKIRKRICNMRAEVRKFLRYNLIHETRPIKLKEWHKSLLNLMHQEDMGIGEVVDETPTNTTNDFTHTTIKMESFDCESEFLNDNFDEEPILPPMDIPTMFYPSNSMMTPFERLTREPPDTQNLSNSDLERAILLAKYELVALQTQAAKEQLELVALQKKNVQNQM